TSGEKIGGVVSGLKPDLGPNPSRAEIPQNEVTGEAVGGLDTVSAAAQTFPGKDLTDRLEKSGAPSPGNVVRTDGGLVVVATRSNGKGLPTKEIAREIIHDGTEHAGAAERAAKGEGNGYRDHPNREQIAKDLHLRAPTSSRDSISRE